MNMSDNANESIDWHSGFAGALELAFRRNRGEITIEREHLLAKEPLRIDFLLIKKKPETIIDNAVGKAFRGHNIIEYKNPNDALNIDVIWKVIGYAGIYKSLGTTVDAIKADDLTVSIVRCSKPYKLFKQLSKEGKTITKEHSGVYRISGMSEIALQVIVTDELDETDFTAFKIMRSNADITLVRSFLREVKNYTEQGDKYDAEAVLRVSATVNQGIFGMIRGDKFMGDILRELMKDDFIAAENRGEEKGIEKGIEIFVEDKLEDNVPEDIIVNKVVNKFKVSDEVASEYIEKCKEKLFANR